MSVLPVGFGSSGGLQITNSVRLRASASAYFSRTFGAGGDRDKWWILIPEKRSTLGATQYLFGSDTASADAVYFNSSDKICVDIAGTNRLISTRVFRDPSAWGAFLVVFDASNGTNDLKLRVYYIDNGFAEITAWDTNTRSAITAGTAKTTLNTAAAVIGKNPTAANSYFDGYLSHFHIGTWSGSQPTPASFGGTDSNGVWVFSGASFAYGTQGSWLDFKDAALTAGSNAGLGKDVSGNGNYWTTNNISVTAGTAYDSMVDTPTNNYATLNPLKQASSITLTEANLRVSCSASLGRIHSTQCITEPTYFEVNWVSGGRPCPGVATPQGDNTTMTGDASADATLWEFFAYNGNKMNGSNAAYGSAAVAGDLIGVAVNPVTGKIWWSINGTWQASGDPAADTNAAFTNIPSTGVVPCIGSQQSGWDCTINFGQAPLRASATWHESAGGYFRYTPPTGFKALCTANLPASGSVTTSGTFTGNAAADGPFVWLNGSPTAMTINSNAVTFGTHADKTAGGFKVRTSSASYNTAGSNTYSITTNAGVFGDSNSAPQPAKGNP